MDDKEAKELQFQQRIAALRRAYVLKFPGKCEDMESLWVQFRQSEDVALLTQLREAAHKLKGSGATYGFDEISDAAMLLESLLMKQRDADKPIGKEGLSSLQRHLDQLKDAMMRAAAEIDI